MTAAGSHYCEVTHGPSYSTWLRRQAAFEAIAGLVQQLCAVFMMGYKYIGVRVCVIFVVAAKRTSSRGDLAYRNGPNALGGVPHAQSCARVSFTNKSKGTPWCFGPHDKKGD